MSPVFRPLPRHGANDGAIEAEVNTVSDGSDPRDRRRLPDPSLYPPPQPTIDRLPFRGVWSRRARGDGKDRSSPPDCQPPELRLREN